MNSFFDHIIEKQGCVILDGALATELEKRGANLNHALWSAKLLIENPTLIKQVHLDYKTLHLLKLLSEETHLK